MTIREQLKKELSDPEYRHAYSDENLNLWIAAQIKVLREQQGLSQKELGEKLGTKQAGISRLESANYSGWSVRVLKKVAEAFDLRLKISFEEFGTLWQEVNDFGRESLQRRSFSDDPEFREEIIPKADQNDQPHVISGISSVLVAPQHAGAAKQAVVAIDQSQDWSGHRKPPSSALGNWAANGSNYVKNSVCI